eukprot:TRINITY_DN1505_c0_g1_i2.p1 TRINITY_DN1505_c0_g1~~TRINITY_DN1505_c0_g1_i2.p1  ORF type:complete len:105 (+),score=36.90 TRINITY_DN1505_c0_g1_i2:85-399(+)
MEKEDFDKVVTNHVPQQTPHRFLSNALLDTVEKQYKVVVREKCKTELDEYHNCRKEYGVSTVAKCKHLLIIAANCTDKNWEKEKFEEFKQQKITSLFKKKNQNL